MSAEALVEHILAGLEPQVQDYVEVRHPTTTAKLLQVISKFEERENTQSSQRPPTSLPLPPITREDLRLDGYLEYPHAAKALYINQMIGEMVLEVLTGMVIRITKDSRV
ncbi:hypothetical protein TNCV_4939171 [Trichonephila clavipes]|nr:hypothetical protein TNCV_4939171 [Trichonephila clavipes]